MDRLQGGGGMGMDAGRGVGATTLHIPSPIIELTPREVGLIIFEISSSSGQRPLPWRLSALGWTHKEIAGKLGVEAKTIQRDVQSGHLAEFAM